jgi:hypothetical protein
MNKETTTSSPNPPQQPHAFTVLDLLASVKFSAIVVLLLILACIAGTVLPQEGQVTQYLASHPAAAGRMAILTTLGLTHVFSAGWFTALLCTLSACLIVCSQRRFKAMIRTSGALRGRAIASLILHSSFLLILAGGLIRSLWGESGHVQFREGQTLSGYESNRGPRPLPFSIRLEKFEIERYPAESNTITLHKTTPESQWGQLTVRWPEKEVIANFPAVPGTEQILKPEDEPAASTNTMKVRILRYEPDFVMDTAAREIRTRSLDPRNPAVQVVIETPERTTTNWLFARHPEFGLQMNGEHGESAPIANLYYRHSCEPPAPPPIKTFRSTVTILDNDHPQPLVRTLAVNSPLSHRGYTFYQSGYDERDLTWTSLQVVRDPGVMIVYAGFVLTMVGLIMLFCLYPQKPVTTRIKHNALPAE